MGGQLGLSERIRCDRLQRGPGRFQPSIHIRRAIPADVPAIEALIGLSVRTLQAQDYSQAQIESALGTVLGVDSALIADGTYFVLEAVSGGGKPASRLMP